MEDQVNPDAHGEHLPFGFLTHDVSRMMRTVFDRELQSLGSTRSQWWVLANLSRRERSGMTQTELAHFLDVGKVTVGGLVDRLEAGGYVERRADERDRRVKRIYVTDKGHEVLVRMVEIASKIHDMVFEGVSDAELRLVEDALSRVKVNIRAFLNEQSSVSKER